MTEIPIANLKEWIVRWDRQQEFYLPNREERFEAMFTVIRHLVASGSIKPQFRLLDLACGPGAIGQRLLAQFGGASYVGVDVDPALLAIASGLEPEFDGRFKVLDRDLAVDTWADGFADHEFDVVASSTALHWLGGGELEKVFAHLGQLIRPGGFFFDLDHLAHSSSLWQDIAASIDDERRERARAVGREDWGSWWAAAREDPYLGRFVVERDLRFPPNDSDDSTDVRPMLSDYVAALERAGFVDIDVLWQAMDDRLLAARRPAE